MSEFKFPTEVVELPSKGLLYPSTNPLSSGKIEMRYMTARHEDILTNQNFIKQGIVIDKLLQELIVSKVNYDDILICDKNAILIAARILSYGKDYSFTLEENGEKTQHTIDLTQLEEKSLDASIVNSGVNEFSFTFPNASQNSITFKLLTIGDEKKIDAEVSGMKKAGGRSAEMSIRLKYIITSVNNNRDAKVIRDFVDNELLASDSFALRKHIAQIQPDVKLTMKLGDVEVPVPITTDFFWPTA